MTNDSFDNRYITDKIVELDIRRSQVGRETILPLNVHENKKYAPVSHFIACCMNVLVQPAPCIGGTSTREPPRSTLATAGNKAS